MKKLIAPIIASVMLSAVFARCTPARYDWVVDIDGVKYTPAEYTLAQVQAFLEAQMITGGEGGEIDGVPMSDWIIEQTIYNLKEVQYIDSEFEERGLEITPEQMEYIDRLTKGDWELISTFYSNNGLIMEHYKMYLVHLYKKQLVFSDIYMSREKRPEIDPLVNEYMEQNLNKITVFYIPKVNDDGSPMDGEQTLQVRDLAAEAVKRLDKGEDISSVAGDILTRAGAVLGSPEDYSDGGKFIQSGYISSSASNLNSGIKKRITALPQGSAVEIEAQDCYNIIYKEKLYDSREEYQRLKYQVVSQIKDEEYNENLRRRCEDFEVICNEAAMEFYSPSKIVASVTEQ